MKYFFLEGNILTISPKWSAGHGRQADTVWRWRDPRPMDGAA